MRKLKVSVYLDSSRTVVVALTESEFGTISDCADRLGTTPGRLMARIGRDYPRPEGQSLSAWIRECTLYAVGRADALYGGTMREAARESIQQELAK